MYEFVCWMFNLHGTKLPVSEISNDKAVADRLWRLLVITVILNWYLIKA
jgi:hypothetical protein